MPPPSDPQPARLVGARAAADGRGPDVVVVPATGGLGRHGARTQDSVVSTEDGVRLLNEGPRDLVEVPG